MSLHKSVARVSLALFILACALGSLSCRGPARPAPSPAKTNVSYDVYFHRAGAPDAPPTAVRRRAALSRATAAGRVRAAVRALLAGPTAAEKSKGYYSSLPANARLLDVSYERPVVRLNFSRELERIGGTARVGALLDELAYTAASIPGIKGVILEIEGERAGTDEHPFTGEGFLFRLLHPPADSAWARRLAPADALDLFIAAIPDRAEMWKLMGPDARRTYGAASGIDVSGFAEGLGSWRAYRVTRQKASGNEASVVIAGRQVLEGNVEPNARYTARMVREDGRWKWELPED